MAESSVRATAQVDDDKMARRKALCLCCKKAAKFAFTNIGLSVIVVVYAIAGAFIFQILEQTNEKEECIQAMNRYFPMENATVSKLWGIASSYNTDDDEELALDAFKAQIQQFRDDVQALGYDGSNCSMMGEDGGPDYQWHFPGSLLFSITIFTTIGYGNIAPQTFWGRLVCISYALVGIPIMLLCLANLGELMANIFRFTYSKVCCCGCCRCCNKRRTKSESDANLSGASYRSSTSPGTWNDPYAAQRNAAPPAETTDMDDDDDDDDDEKVSVPLTVTMGLVAGYVFMGSLLFGVWEGWDWLASAYYCFITISTIGFGDLVPGSDGFHTTADNFKMIAAAAYIVFGMAIMSMAFNLVQEEIVAKFVWLGQKLGVVSKPSGDVDVDKLGDGRQLAVPALGPSQPPVGATAAFPSPAGPGGSFNSAVNPPMPVYAVGGPRYNSGATGETKATGLQPGDDSPLTRRAAKMLAAASTKKH